MPTSYILSFIERPHKGLLLQCESQVVSIIKSKSQIWQNDGWWPQWKWLFGKNSHCGCMIHKVRSGVMWLLSLLKRKLTSHPSHCWIMLSLSCILCFGFILWTSIYISFFTRRGLKALSAVLSDWKRKHYYGRRWRPPNRERDPLRGMFLCIGNLSTSQRFELRGRRF